MAGVMIRGMVKVCEIDGESAAKYPEMDMRSTIKILPICRAQVGRNGEHLTELCRRWRDDLLRRESRRRVPKRTGIA